MSALTLCGLSLSVVGLFWQSNLLKKNPDNATFQLRAETKHFCLHLGTSRSRLAQRLPHKRDRKHMGSGLVQKRDLILQWQKLKKCSHIWGWPSSHHVLAALSNSVKKPGIQPHHSMLCTCCAPSAHFFWSPVLFPSFSREVLTQLGSESGNPADPCFTWRLFLKKWTVGSDLGDTVQCWLSAVYSMQ